MSFIKDTPIARKIPMLLVGFCLLSTSITSLAAFQVAKNNVFNAYQAELSALSDVTRDSIDGYLKSIQEDLAVVAKNPYTLTALDDFKISWSKLEGDRKAYLQNLYIATNPFPAGQKEKLDYAKDGSEYSLAHAKHHQWFRNFLNARGYYDIFLVAPNGDVVFTVYKEADYATNLKTGEWKDTDLGKAYDLAIHSKDPNAQFFFDFVPYAPSNNVPASFIAQPIVNAAGVNVGVLIFQMPVARLNDMMQLKEGMGKTGRAYVVGSDNFLRTDPVITDDTNEILKTEIKNPLIEEAKTKDSGTILSGRIEKSNGQAALLSTSILDVLGTKWFVSVEKEVSEILEPVKQMILIMAGSALAVIAILGILGVLVGKAISNPLARAVDSMKDLTNDKLDTEISDTDRHDEIGDITAALQIFKDNALKVKELQAEQERQRIQQGVDKKEAMDNLANSFDERTSHIIESLMESSFTMKNTAEKMSVASSETAQASSIVASAATEADSNVQTVAAASEELAASSAEIARQIADVAKKATSASQEAQSTSRSVSELNQLADSIGEVVSAIKDIAEQTNLLALNATIEAARAGDAGKGFAVVADEVKKLATETAKKTDEIDERVVKIQTAIRASVEAMSRIIDNVQTIDNATSSVAGAVQEQNIATSEIGRNVTEASTGTQQVSQSIQTVEETSRQTGASAQEVLGAAGQLSDLSTQLSEQVKAFLREIRQG
jgi:methyl-accepting chemotaxis protein